jgi:hypothetical protein
MDLEEFAWATGRRELADSIRENFIGVSEMPPHDTAMGTYREYLADGGMPEAVAVCTAYRCMLYRRKAACSTAMVAVMR